MARAELYWPCPGSNMTAVGACDCGWTAVWGKPPRFTAHGWSDEMRTRLGGGRGTT